MHDPQQQRRWDERYRAGDLPWDQPQADPRLIRALRTFGPVQPPEVFEAGCGTGTNAIWLARQGYQVTALDLAPTAIERAKAKAAKAGLRIQWHVLDVLDVPEEMLETWRGRFGLFFDRGCFHSMPADRRADYVRLVVELLVPEGLWISLIGNADDDRPEGPPKLSAREVVGSVEETFEILLLEATRGQPQPDRPPPLMWLLAARKRD